MTTSNIYLTSTGSKLSNNRSMGQQIFITVTRFVRQDPTNGITGNILFYRPFKNNTSGKSFDNFMQNANKYDID